MVISSAGLELASFVDIRKLLGAGIGSVVCTPLYLVGRLSVRCELK